MIKPHPDPGGAAVTMGNGWAAPASTMTQAAFVAVCVLTGAVMLLVAGLLHFVVEAGRTAPPVPGVPFFAGVLLLVVGAVAARRSRLPGWLGPVAAATLIGLSMAALWFNGVLPLLFFAPLVMLLHLLLSPTWALWAMAWVLAWPVVMVSDWMQAEHMPHALRAWAGAVLVGLMSQFVVRQNRRFAEAARTLLAAVAGANRDLHGAERETRAARERTEGLAADLARQLGELRAERDRARAAQEIAEIQRVRAQEALVQNLVLQHEHERLFRLLDSSTSAMPHGLMVFDPRGRIEFANRMAWTLFGADASTASPAGGLSGLIRDGLSQGFFEPSSACLLSRSVLEYEHWLAGSGLDGPQESASPAEPAAAVALHDLHLFRGWPIMFGADGGLEFMADARAPTSAVADAGQAPAISLIGRTASGRLLRVDSSRVGDGGLVCIYTDVTDLVGAAEAFGRSLADLRAKDAQLQAEMLRSRSEVELNNRFVASVSHEIRTAVQGIAGIAAMFGQPIGGRIDVSMVQDLEASARDLNRLSEDLLSLARLRRAEFGFEPRVFDPAAMLARCLQSVMARVDPSTVSVERCLVGQLPRLVGDEQRVAQVVVNLLQNAAKFTSCGRIRVDAWVEVDEDAVDPRVRVLHVRVADTGRGIPFGLVGRVFEPFDQGEESTNRHHGGAGLGLALSRELCEAMGGGIGVFSRPGVGSVFEMRVRLSLAEDAASSPAPAGARDVSGSTPVLATDARHGQHGPAAVLAGSRVLVVDDNRLNRKLMSMWIAAQGADVATAADGQEGVRAASSADFDCVLLDMSMPVMNGLEAARAIRAASSEQSGPDPESVARMRRAHVPLIGVTAMARREDRLLCLAAGMDAHLAKPVRRQDLIQEIRRVVSSRAWLLQPHRPVAR